MKKVFIASDGHDEVVIKRKAKGYKKVDLSSLKCMQPYIVETVDETTMSYLPTGESINENDHPVYTILCKQFGLVDLGSDERTKVSIMLLDDGKMLVTLWKGVVVVELNGSLVSLEVQKNVQELEESEVLWVGRDRLMPSLSYSCAGKGKSFLYDTEFVYNFVGYVKDGLDSFKAQHLAKEDLDLSLGALACYEQLNASFEEEEANYRDGFSLEDEYSACRRDLVELDSDPYAREDPRFSELDEEDDFDYLEDTDRDSNSDETDENSQGDYYDDELEEDEEDDEDYDEEEDYLDDDDDDDDENEDLLDDEDEDEDEDEDFEDEEEDDTDFSDDEEEEDYLDEE